MEANPCCLPCPVQQVNNHVNPYDPTPAKRQVGEQPTLDAPGNIVCRLVFTPDHMIETLSRYRSQYLGRQVGVAIRYTCASILMAAALFAFLYLQNYRAGALMLAFACFLFVSHMIDNFLARRRLHKSPHCNSHATIMISESGLRFDSDIEESNLKWTAFSRAVVFGDGVLLFQGPAMLHWIPDRFLDREDDKKTVRALAKANLPTQTR